MPRIDPSQLLRTLSVLLAKDGGIRSVEEVCKIQRIIIGVYILEIILGSQNSPVNAKVLQKIGIQVYLHSHIVL